MIKATPHKDHLTALCTPYLHLFRHIAQKFLDIRQYACKISVQSDEKSDCVIRTQSLCGIALKYRTTRYNGLPCLCHHLKKRSGRFYLPNDVQIHFGVLEFKSLTVGLSEKGLQGCYP